MTTPVEFLDLDDLVHLATLLFGDPPPLRDVGLLVMRVATDHPDPEELAGALRQLCTTTR